MGLQIKLKMKISLFHTVFRQKGQLRRFSKLKVAASFLKREDENSTRRNEKVFNLLFFLLLLCDHVDTGRCWHELQDGGHVSLNYSNIYVINWNEQCLVGFSSTSSFHNLQVRAAL